MTILTLTVTGQQQIKKKKCKKDQEILLCIHYDPHSMPGTVQGDHKHRKRKKNIERDVLRKKKWHIKRRAVKIELQGLSFFCIQSD